MATYQLTFYDNKQGTEQSCDVKSLEEIDEPTIKLLQDAQSVSFATEVTDTRPLLISESKYEKKCWFCRKKRGKRYEPKAVNFVIEKCTRLEELHLNNLTPCLLKKLVTNCPTLKSLHFENIMGDFIEIWPPEPNQFEEPLPKKPSRTSFNRSWEALKILICPHNVREKTLTMLIKNLPNLETIMICFSPEGEANHTVLGKCFKYLGPNIKHLILGNLVIQKETMDNILNFNGKKLQELEILFPLFEQPFERILELSHLRKLTIKVTHCSFASVARISNLTNLESLQVERVDLCNDTLEEIFSSVFKKCHKLREFKVSGVFKLYSYKLLDIMGESNCKLTHLDIQPNMYKKEINWLKIEIARSIEVLTSMKTLQHLALPYSDVDDSHLKSLLDNCPDLTVVDFSNCKKIHDCSYIITKAEKNPNSSYSFYLSLTSIKSHNPLPSNLKLCICNPYQDHCLPLRPPSFHELI